MNKQQIKLFISTLIFCVAIYDSFGQARLSNLNGVIEEDSICKFGKRYQEPERAKIHFPAIKVTDSYKINAIHLAPLDACLPSPCRSPAQCCQATPPSC